MDRTAKPYIVGAVTAALMAGVLIAAAPPASAGCVNADWLSHPFAQKCDDPIQPDGTWQRCVVFETMISGTGTDRSTTYLPSHRCDLMGPDQHPWGAAFNDPPTHIDD